MDLEAKNTFKESKIEKELQQGKFLKTDPERYPIKYTLRGDEHWKMFHEKQTGSFF